MSENRRPARGGSGGCFWLTL